jgi:hypothetical protein
VVQLVLLEQYKVLLEQLELLEQLDYLEQLVQGLSGNWFCWHKEYKVLLVMVQLVLLVHKEYMLLD